MSRSLVHNMKRRKRTPSFPVKIGADGAAYLSEALKENTSIMQLDVQWNMIGKVKNNILRTLPNCWV